MIPRSKTKKREIDCFIRAEAVDAEDFIKYGSAEKCKEKGKLRIEGKDYIVKDGDVLYFRVNP